MNMFLYELRASRKSTIVWTISLVSVLVLFMSLFPSFLKDVDEVNKLLEGFPEPVRKALGLEIGSHGSLLGYYSYSFTYLALAGAIQAMNLGTNILSKEVREKTADFLLTKPVTRTQIVKAKLLAAVTSLLITNLVFLGAAGLTATMVKTEAYDAKVFYMISITLFFIQLIFLAFGLLASVIIPRIKSVLAVSLGTVFAFFLIGMLASTGEDEVKRLFSPFKYFEAKKVMYGGGLDGMFVGVSFALIIGLILLTFIGFKKRDLFV
ncbi:ABC transporter permease subunit [Robertmurraya andreesenii]|uniref:ABC-2 type transport system permease protein n=1 Tax=Anoxybacillus andreesenii TaxID=1325932 RepID=A0ABT9V5K6_9BACL|nr:ABC transporter permease subunit [Robertmurraya andreesenii]MDQ0156222.1 ABC-2 type transport system permease protein [Robertmurraya andreesenii]